jgi:hypothetical protein
MRPKRLGLLGPVRRDSPDAATALETAASFLLSKQSVARAIYLGDDDALDRVVEEWARRLFGSDPSDDGVWQRAAELVEDGGPAEIEAFVSAERERRKLRIFESLPRPTLRSLEMIGDRVTVLIYDKSLLDEEDIFPAALLIYGKGDAPLARRIGTRWFLSPGRLSDAGGVCVLEEIGDDLVARFYSARGDFVAEERLLSAAAAKLKVQGSGTP